MHRRWRWITYVKLLLAGWRPNRNVLSHLRLPPSFALFPEAKRVLAEYGNVRLGDRNEYYLFDPFLGEEGAKEILPFERILGRRLYPLGINEHQDVLYLVIDEKGIVYGIMLDECEPLASSFEVAVETFVRGYVGARERENDLRSVGLSRKVWKLE